MTKTDEHNLLPTWITENFYSLDIENYEYHDQDKNRFHFEIKF